MKYHEGKVTEAQDGTYTASYLCKRQGGKPYYALAGQGYGYQSMDEAKSAIDEANGAQAEYLKRFDVMTYNEARKRGVGTHWPRPNFGVGEVEVLTVAYVGRSYIVSRLSGNLYLSMGDADCQAIGQDSPGEVQAFVKNFEAPSKPADTCHYCGMPAKATSFFDEPVCNECGG